MKKSTLNNTGRLQLFALCCLLLAVSCKAKKQVVAAMPPVSTNITPKPPDTKVLKLEVIKAAQTSFNTFAGKASTKLNINGSTNDVTLNIRIQSGHKIWVSITAIAGIEVARALITPDSLEVINRLQSVYLKKPFSYVNTLAGDQVNYKTVESLLIGNAIPETMTEHADLQTNADNTIAINGNMAGVVYKLLINSGMKVNQTSLSNQGAGQSLLVNNGGFIQSGNKIIPSQIDISSVVKDKKIQVNLRYTKTEFDQPLEFPFSIPSRYTEAN